MPEAVAPPLVEPAHLWVPDRVGSYGDEAADLAALAGRELDAEQRLAVDAMLSYGPGGRWVALESAVVEARQNGKTSGVILPVVLFDLFLLGADRIVWTAHLFRTARDAFADVVACVDRAPELSGRVKKVTYANGEEAVELHSGARLEFLARSKGGGRGLGGKRLVMDEALFLSSESMGALIPTLSARPDPQIMYGSSAGTIFSDHLRGLRDRGRAGGDPSLIWVEWCAPGGWADPPCVSGRTCTHVVGTDGCALDDEVLWLRANPALGRRIKPEYVRAERRALPPAEFGRERLGWFDDPADGDALPLEAWRSCVDAGSVASGRPVFVVDASPGLRSAAIVAAAVNADGVPHVEVVEHHAGTDWVVERCRQLLAHDPLAWVVDATGPVGALVPDLAVAGVEPTQMGVRDMGRACTALAAGAVGRAFRHLDDPILTRALVSASRRDVGDGLWVWSRRRSGGDICPLVAATLALFTLQPPQPAVPLVAWR